MMLHFFILYRKKFLLSFILLILFPFISLHAQVTVTETIIASRDSYISSVTQGNTNEINTNFGSSTQLQSGDNNQKRTLLYFDLSSIPSNAIIDSAYVTLRVVGGSGNRLTCGVYYLTRSWEELTVTWNFPWTNPGGDNTQIIPIEQVDVTNTQIYRTWMLTSTVQSWINGTIINNGLLLYGTNSANHQKYFASREHQTPEYRPRLTIVYRTTLDSLWLRANYGTSTTIIGTNPPTEGGAISKWINVWDATSFDQDNNNYKPLYRNTTNLINFNPTVQFDGTNDFLIGDRNYGILAQNNFTTFSIVKSTLANRYIWSHYNYVSRAAAYSISTVQRLSSFNQFLNGINTIITTPPVVSVLLGVRRTADTTFNLFYNGSIENTNNIPSFGGTFVGQKLLLGSLGGAPSNTFQGTIAELLIYPRYLTDIEVQRVNSYLATKYGISMSINYIGSSGTAFWNQTNGFNNGIFGLGRDDAFSLHQQISASITNTFNFLTLSTNNNFTLPNAQHSNINTNLSYFMVGSNSSTAPLYQTTELNNTMYVTRLNYEWRVQNTNFNQTVNLKFAGYGSNDLRTTYLIKKNNDHDFSTGTIEVGSLNVNGEIYGVTLNNNEYFTLAFKTVAPGGISDNLKFWVKADYGIILNGNGVRQWNDMSGFNLYLNQERASNQPQYKTNSQNFNPSVQFVATSSHFFQRNQFFDMFDSAYSFYLVGFNSAGERTFINVNQTGGTSINSGIIIESTGSNSLRFLHRNPVGLNGGDDLVAPANLSETKSSIMSFFRNRTIKHELWVNGTYNIWITPTNPTFAAGVATDMTVGRRDSVNLKYMNGEIAEIIIFGTENENNRIRVESYLATKYGISLNDGNGEIYTSSDTTIKYWHNSNNIGYNHDIFGIGLDEISTLNQKQSRSINPDAFFSVFLLTSIGDSLPATNLMNTNLFEADKSFLMFGNNNADHTLWTRSVSSPFRVKYRIARIWKFQKTGIINNLVITVNPSDLPSNTGPLPICMLVSNTPDMTNAAVYPMTKVGATWRVFYNFSEGSYITFGYGYVSNFLRHGKTVIEGIRFPYGH